MDVLWKVKHNRPKSWLLCSGVTITYILNSKYQMADLISSAGVGALAGEVLKYVLEVINTISLFKPQFEQLKETLESIILTVETIKNLEVELDADTKNSHTEKNIARLLEHLRNANKLISKCSSLKNWEFWNKHKYSKELQKFDSDLRVFSSWFMQAEAWVDRKKSLVLQNEVIRKLSSMSIASSDYGSSYSNFSRGDSVYSTALPELPSKIVGLHTSLEELRKKLLNEDVFTIEVCAPGGCGKTTVVTKLCQDADVKAKFREIAFITVSQSPNLLEICHRLWARLINANPRPKFMDENDAISVLKKHLNKRKQWPALVVLDDVWCDEVLEKLLFRNVGIKTVVTSRNTFKTKFDSVCTLKFLGPEDSRDLFCHWAFSPDQVFDQLNNMLVEQVLKGCRGLPLALKVIGRSLRDEPIQKWRRTADMLVQGGQIFQDYRSILDCLRTGLISLNEKHKECFMDLGSFPEDEKIPASSIIDMWIEIHDLSEDDAYVTLLEFNYRNLITLVERTRCRTKCMAWDIDDSISDIFVIQHDLLRELAIYTSKENQRCCHERLFMNQADLRKKQKQQDETSKARILSINTGQMDLQNWFDMSLPSVEVLILNFAANSYCLPPFLGKMESLKVLVIANHNLGTASLSNLPSLSSLKNLRRVRLERISLPFASTFTEPLQNLQKLALLTCDVSQLDKFIPLDISRLFPRMAELELDYCKQFETLPPGICDLINLEKLNITNCPDFASLPEGLGSLSKLVALRLRACANLEGLPDSLCNLESLKLLDISHCSNMESLPENMGELKSLEKIDMSWCAVERLPASVTRMESLNHVECNEDMARLWRLCERTIGKLRVQIQMDDVSLKFLM